MFDRLFFVALPYVALFALVVGTLYRLKRDPFSQSAQSSQFLEERKLLWGIIPFHFGVFVILALHFVVFLMPSVWQTLIANKVVLIAIEAIGVIATLACLLGLFLLLLRRLTEGKLQRVTTSMDLFILSLLIVQVLSGLGIALGYRWGSAWATHTLVPYVWSLLKLQPDPSYMTQMPLVVKLHVAGAWVTILLIPFSRLIHIFSLPLQYLMRAPQRVVWANERRETKRPDIRIAEVSSRRMFIKGVGGAGAAGALLAVGTTGALVGYFKAPEMTPQEALEIEKKRLAQLQLTVEQRELQLERMSSEVVLVAQMSELKSKTGKYFIDYQMQQAMAFLGDDGYPLLISAKCTHLGCGVGNEVDDDGNVLCPCHVSYFNIKTGEPNSGAPAKEPLPHIGWLLKDPTGKDVASRGPGGELVGGADPDILATCSVYIARQFEQEA